MKIYRWIVACTVLGICLIWFGHAYGGDRPTVTGNRLLDVGECDKGSTVCVTEEEEDKVFLYQFIDSNGNGKCNFVILFKKIEDPFHGTFYEYNSTKDCPANAGRFNPRSYKWVDVTGKG